MTPPLPLAGDPSQGAPSPPPPGDLPRNVLYATAARLGGTGLDTSSLEGVRASYRAHILGRAVGFADNQDEIPSRAIRSLRFSPVRALSSLPSQRYYAAKKLYLDRTAARLVARGRFDFFHGWSGDCLRTLIAAKQRDIPCVIDIPTWHRNKGRQKPFVTQSEREVRAQKGTGRLRHLFRISRQRVLTEYALADLILVPSRCAAETFLDVGTPPEKLHYVGRGVDIDRYTPTTQPPLFRLTFVGALIERKGVHLLLEAWKKLALKDAELVLVGTPHPQIRPAMEAHATESVRVTGFTTDVLAHLQRSTAFVFPTECEGFAKATLEAAACALPLITTRQSGDAIVDGETGTLIPPNDPAALADAIRDLYDHPERIHALGQAARQRVTQHFTWDHYRTRILQAYARALQPPTP